MSLGSEPIKKSVNGYQLKKIIKKYSKHFPGHPVLYFNFEFFIIGDGLRL